MKSSRFFTLEEANGLLPQLAACLAHVIEKKELYSLRHDRVFMHELLTEAEQAGGVPEDALAPELEKDFLGLEEDLQDLEREVKKIAALGCILHDLEHGYVDFPCQKDGELIFLCWKRGEDAITFYHRKNSRSEERLPLLIA
jgi:hypothetical protein